MVGDEFGAGTRGVSCDKRARCSVIRNHSKDKGKFIFPDISTEQFSILAFDAFVADDVDVCVHACKNPAKKGTEIPEKGNHSSRFLEQSISISHPRCILLLFASHVHARSVVYLRLGRMKQPRSECQRVISFPLGPRS